MQWWARLKFTMIGQHTPVDMSKFERIVVRHICGTKKIRTWGGALLASLA